MGASPSFARARTRDGVRRGQTLTELVMVLMLIVLVRIRAVVVVGERANDNLRWNATPTARPSGPVLLARWVFDPSCNGWWNAAWSGTGCNPDGSPKRTESPVVETPSGARINVVADGGSGGASNLVVKLAEYEGATEIRATNVGTLASGKGSVVAEVELSETTDRIKITATGPGELQEVELWLYP